MAVRVGCGGLGREGPGARRGGGGAWGLGVGPEIFWSDARTAGVQKCPEGRGQLHHRASLEVRSGVEAVVVVCLVRARGSVTRVSSASRAVDGDSAGVAGPGRVGVGSRAARVGTVGGWVSSPPTSLEPKTPTPPGRPLNGRRERDNRRRRRPQNRRRRSRGNDGARWGPNA